MKKAKILACQMTLVLLAMFSTLPLMTAAAATPNDHQVTASGLDPGGTATDSRVANCEAVVSENVNFLFSVVPAADITVVANTELIQVSDNAILASVDLAPASGILPAGTSDNLSLDFGIATPVPNLKPPTSLTPVISS